MRGRPGAPGVGNGFHEGFSISIALVGILWLAEAVLRMPRAAMAQAPDFAEQVRVEEVEAVGLPRGDG